MKYFVPEDGTALPQGNFAGRRLENSASAQSREREKREKRKELELKQGGRKNSEGIFQILSLI